jgi:hypothetical protein
MNRRHFAALAGAAAAGIFAGSARAQIRLPAQNQAPGQGGAPSAQPNDLGRVVGDGKIVLRSPAMRVGQKMLMSFRDFPETGQGDVCVVVAGGAPDAVQPNSQGEKPLAFTYLSKWQVENGWEAGPFAPGLYEVRWLTTLYNNESKYEVGARAQFTVTR